MPKLKTIFITFLLTFLLSHNFAQQHKYNFPDNLEVPVCPSHSSDHEKRKFTWYEICYRESYEQCEWSAYKLTSQMLEKNTQRTNNFRADPEISTESASLEDYKGSGFDRGHLTPAADMAFDKNAMSETFYMSNMSPQFPDFNRGIWMHLEAQVRKWAEKYGEIYIVSGPVLDKDCTEYETIGANKVAIPQYYYKTILTVCETNGKTSVEAIAFIIPNKKCTGSYMDYAVSVDEAEKITGIDFYSLLDDETENKTEKHFNPDIWK